MQSETKIKTPFSFLIIDRDVAFCTQMQSQLPAEFKGRCTVTVAIDVKLASSILRAEQFDVILVDVESIGAKNNNAENIISKICRLAGKALVIATNSCGSVSLAVDMMGAGAHDFVAKPLNIKNFEQRIVELGQRHGHDKSLAAIGSTAAISSERAKSATNICMEDFGKLVGTSAQIKDINAQIEQMAQSSSAVFITGESGTGKNMCAKSLHQKGPKANAPFIAINCPAIPHELMESEIFGVVQGAYTGADKDRSGAIELAKGGVLFLDEIGELSLDVQAKLLKFLQTGAISRVGETLCRPMDVRVICATSKAPTQLIAAKKFRQDLFYHLHVLNIHMPPLRQRSTDILPLAHEFLRRYALEENKRFLKFSSKAQELIVSREWFGNVEELQNLIHKIVIMFDGSEVNSQMMHNIDDGFCSAHIEPVMQPFVHMPIEPMWRQEQKIIETAIACHNGNVSLAAAALEISPSTIYRKRQSWDNQVTNYAHMELAKSG
ncbi:Nitrogen regulation protein NR(I) [hydrothermal vent metagenome]|uniref:Nitrogen regulation protein NR(I) n=1 Tax=hydrothermal vent metagenome TaxID=652676 RepID=A0A3B0UY87_9ZZZZ